MAVVDKTIDLRKTTERELKELLDASDLKNLQFSGEKKSDFKDESLKPDKDSLETRARAVRILEFASSRTSIKEVISRSRGIEQVDDGEYRKNLENIMGREYKFESSSKFFSDMADALEKAGATEDTSTKFRKNIYGAWKEMISQGRPIIQDYDLDDYLDLSYRHTDLTNMVGGFHRKIFLPALIDQLKKKPILGVFDGKTFDELDEQYSSFEQKVSRGATIQLTPEELRVLLVRQEIERMHQEYRETDKPYVLRREYSSDQLHSVPIHRDLISEDTQKVTVDYIPANAGGTLWKIHDSTGVDVIRDMKVEGGVDETSIAKKVNELPDCVPKVRYSIQGDRISFVFRYVEGMQPRRDNPEDVALVKKSKSELLELDWYICGDDHPGNFLIPHDQSNKRAYWVDKDIFEQMVENKTYPRDVRERGSKSRYPDLPWNK